MTTATHQRAESLLAHSDIETIRSPALIIDADAVDANITATLTMLGGDADRWRPHLKTSKLLFTMRRIVERGVRQAKVATSLELETACQAGFEDVLVAFPMMGPQVDAVAAVARRFPNVRVSALVEHPSMVAPWTGTGVDLFIDLNPGMDRTGAAVYRSEEVEAIVRAIADAGLHFGGLHYYDGHASSFPAAERARRVHQGYDKLFALIERGFTPPEVITAGTPAFPHAVSYRRFVEAGILHRVSPGTVVYNDARSLTQLPAAAGYRNAVYVLSRVVSHPTPTRFTCDAGHKTVSADAGDPTCVVVGYEDYSPNHPSEEHLPVDVSAGTTLPPRGEVLWLVPQHVCPTVNNFDHAVIVSGGRIAGVEPVSARGRHAPLD